MEGTDEATMAEESDDTASEETDDTAREEIVYTKTQGPLQYTAVRKVCKALMTTLLAVVIGTLTPSTISGWEYHD